jgi:hypothetical protein
MSDSPAIEPGWFSIFSIIFLQYTGFLDQRAKTRFFRGITRWRDTQTNCQIIREQLFYPSDGPDGIILLPLLFLTDGQD